MKQNVQPVKNLRRARKLKGGDEERTKEKKGQKPPTLFAEAYLGFVQPHVREDNKHLLALHLQLK